MFKDSKEYVKVKRAWLERLIEIGELADAESKANSQYLEWIPHLIGYIQGSKSILKNEK